MGANLVPAVRNFSIESNFVGDPHEVDDGCVTPGPHKVLRFDFVSKNVGNADFLVGRPVDRPDLFYYSAAHKHYHMKEFNQYRLFDTMGNLVVPSKKPGFCLADVEQVLPSAGPRKFQLTCKDDEVMGISAGWADVYQASLECQYLVIDGVPDGDYTLLATTNTAHAIAEDNFDDNTVCQGLRITGNTLQVLATPPLHVELSTPVVNFNDVPEGETAARPVEFEVRSCGMASFSIVSGPTKLTGPAGTVFGTVSTPGSTLGEEHSLLPRNAFLWLTYKGTAAGDVATGQVTVKCNESGQQWIVPITANTIKRPTVAVVLVLDQSGSMGLPAGTGAKRIEVLHDAASRFVELAQPNNGIGLVRFDHKAYPIDNVLKLSDPAIDPNRPKLVADVKATAPNGATSIGNGLELARSIIDPVTGYDNKAIVVFTDGLENTSKYIADVKSLITDRTFAIGLGTAQQVSTAALNALTKETGGYLLISGSLSSAIDDYFRLSKYFLQILAAVTNNHVVRDPSGYIAPGQVVRVPFVLNSSDIDATAILLTDRPFVQFGLETPEGHVVGPAEALALGATVAAGTNMVYYRFGLPLLGGGTAAHAGTWHAVLGVGDRGRLQYVDRAGYSGADAHGVRYSVSVHAYSNVRMAASLSQNSFEPGATLSMRAVLSEFGIPLAGSASVRAEVREPDGTSAVISLTEVKPGVFESALSAATTGVYQVRVVADGLTHRGETFTREQLLSGVTVIGGNTPPPRTAPGDHRDEALCHLLECLLSTDVLGRFLQEHHIDAAALQKCVKTMCQSAGAPPTDRELAEREGTLAPAQATLTDLLARPDFAEGLRQLLQRSGAQ
jgi:hypothetical protein